MFSTDSINYIEFRLLEGQCDLILRALELYAYNFHYIVPNNDDKVDLRNQLLYYTYHEILNNYTVNRFNPGYEIKNCKTRIESRKRNIYYTEKNKYKKVS